MTSYASLLQAASRLDANWRWPHFTLAELACRCQGRYCHGSYWHDPEFLDGLEALRARIGKPIRINSGHRCALWNAHIGGAPRSQHKQIAADVCLAGHDRDTLFSAAQSAGFTGLGCGQNFLHIDRRARPARWFYPGSLALWKT